MNLFELFVKIGVKDEASGKLKDISSKLGNGLRTASKIGLAAVGAAATGITALTTAAVNNYAEYEQLVGGVETLFKGSADTVMKYAEGAYASAGLSANQYMTTVTSFSASLLQSLGGDTEKAAKYADKAITDMADNANKMGTSIEMIQNAYQGFAKQNYTMLDNLKLGYGGTKEEMQRLLDDAEKLPGALGKDFDISNYADIVEAIHLVQEEMGIAGATALEAGTTIQGSVNSMKAAWSNLVTGFADGNADIEGLINNLVTTIVGDGTEGNLGVIGNVLPAIETALGGVVKLIEGAAPKIIEILPGLVKQIVPSLISAAVELVNSVVAVIPDLLNTLISSIVDNADSLAIAAVSLVEEVITSVLGQLPKVVQLGLDLIVSLGNGIANSTPTLLKTITDVVMEIANTLTSPESLSEILGSALEIIIELGYGLMDSIPQLINAIQTVIINIADFLVDPKNLALILKAALDIVIALGTGIVNSIPVILKNFVTLYAKIFENFASVDWSKLGKDLVAGFKNGISRAWTSLQTWFRNLFGDLIGIAKRILGIASPSKVFKKIGGFTAEGFGAGFEDEFAHVKDEMEDALNFDDASVGIDASIRKVGAEAAVGSFGGTSIGNITINIDGAKYSDEQSLASAIALEIQNMTDRRAAVYA